MRTLPRALLALALVLLLATGARAAERLPALGVDLAATSVSGISSGAYMAGQFQLAFSADVVGAGIVAGGPWGCAVSGWSSWGLPTFGGAVNAGRALTRCMATTGGEPDGAELARRAIRYAERGRIDPIENLARQRIYLFHGEGDSVVARPVVLAAAELYRVLGVPKANLRTVLKLETGRAGHALIVDSHGSECGANASPFIADCGYDQAAAILSWIYPDFRRERDTPKGRLLVFDQTEFLPGAVGFGLAREGVAYVPPSCAATPGCRVHIAFHGCLQSRTLDEVGDRFVEDAGYLRYADANRLVLLFPQTNANTAPNACWDWWGYASSDVLSQRAPQLAATRAMLARLGETP